MTNKEEKESEKTGCEMKRPGTKVATISTTLCLTSLCLKEKFYIIFNPAGASLNQRTELFSVCRHRQDMLLEKICLEANLLLGIQNSIYLTNISFVNCR